MADATDEKKKLGRVPAAGILAAVIAVAGGVGRASAPSVPDTTVIATHLRVLGDGQLALGLAARVGRYVDAPELVWSSTGEVPRLNGKPLASGVAASLGKDAAVFAVIWRKSMDKERTTVRLLRDSAGKLEAIAVDVPRGQLVFDTSGGNPKLNGKPVDPGPVADVGAAAAVFCKQASDVSGLVSLVRPQ